MRHITNPKLDRRLILRSTSWIPGGETKLRYATGPHTTHQEGVPEPMGQFPAAGGP